MGRHRHRFNPKHDPPSRRELETGIKQRPDDGPAAYKPKKVGDPSHAQIWTPTPFYVENLQAVAGFVVGGVEVDLIGGNVQSAGQGTSVQAPSSTPFMSRGTLDLYKPIALDAFSMPVSAFPTGTSVIWRLYVGGRTVPGFEARGLPDGIGQYAPRSLQELREGQSLRVTAQLVSNGMGLSKIGIRLGGTWWPIGAAISQGWGY